MHMPSNKVWSKMFIFRSIHTLCILLMTATEGYSLDQRELSVSQTSETVATMRYTGRAQLMKVVMGKLSFYKALNQLSQCFENGFITRSFSDSDLCWRSSRLQWIQRIPALKTIWRTNTQTQILNSMIFSRIKIDLNTDV